MSALHTYYLNKRLFLQTTGVRALVWGYDGVSLRAARSKKGEVGKWSS